MLNITNVSLYAFRVALRWTSMYGKYPEQITDWTLLQSEKIQDIATEVDRRRDSKRYSPVVKFAEWQKDE